jgi:hypothetical protein
MQDPGKFDNFRRTSGAERMNIPSGIDVIWGHPRGAAKEVWQLQALRFPVEDWTASEARKWLRERKFNFMAFEAATEENKKVNENIRKAAGR